jgi:hypothetical protein
VRLGDEARQLLCHLECPLAIAPRGMGSREKPQLERIGVGFDDGPQARAALELAGSIAGPRAPSSRCAEWSMIGSLAD